MRSRPRVVRCCDSREDAPLQTSTIVGAIIILVAVALAVGAPWLTRKRIWAVRGIAFIGGRRLSEHGRQLEMIHLELSATFLALVGISVCQLFTSPDIEYFLNLVGGVIFIANLAIGFIVTSPALHSGAAFIDPPETRDLKPRPRGPHIM